MFLHKHFVPGGAATSEFDDIARNLGYILRTKRGCGYFLESYGLSDAGYRTPEEMIEGLGREIADNIRLFEPRVELVDFEEVYDEGGGRATLLVNLRMRASSEPLRLVVDLAKNAFDVVAVKPGATDGGGG